MASIQKDSSRPLSPLVIFLIFALFALLLTYPLARHLLTHIPRGSEEVGTVPFLNLWTLQWNLKQLRLGYPNYWDAPIFAPQPSTFTFSESQPLSALLAAPVWLGSQAPALAYNFLVLLFLTLNGWFACGLMRGWGLSKLTALCTGLWIQAVPFVAQEMGVLQLLALFGFLWSLLFLDRFFYRPTLRRAVGLALGAPITFFTCSYYGLFSLFFLPLAFALFWRKRHLTGKTLGYLTLGVLLIILLSGPVLLAQQQRLENLGFTRSTKTIENNSARLSDYLKFLDDNLLYGQILRQKSGQGQRLFPGVMPVILAGLGLLGLKQTRPKIYLMLALLLALILSTGLRFNLQGNQPYQWVRDYLPGFAQLRSPFRFAVFVQLHLGLLAGFGLHNLGRWLSTGHTPLRLLVASLVISEALALPLPLQAVPPLQQAMAWQTWLNEQPQSVRIVMLPFASQSGVAHFEQTTRWMLANDHLQGEMLNGYSGFFPSDHANLRDKMLEFPTLAGLQLLKEKGVNYVVVDESLPNAPSVEKIEAYLPQVYQDSVDQITIYRLNNP